MEWCNIYIMTSSNGHIFRVTLPLCGKAPVTSGFPSQSDSNADLLQTCPLMKTCVKLWTFCQLSCRTYDSLTSVWIIHRQNSENLVDMKGEIPSKCMQEAQFKLREINRCIFWVLHLGNFAPANDNDNENRTLHFQCCVHLQQKLSCWSKMKTIE